MVICDLCTNLLRIALSHSLQWRRIIIIGIWMDHGGMGVAFKVIDETLQITTLPDALHFEA